MRSSLSMPMPSLGAVASRPRPADLVLPEVCLLPAVHYDSDFYGASVVAAEYCGFAEPPLPPRGYWMHAWGPKQYFAFNDPLLYFGPVDLKGKNDYHWVGRQD